VKRLETYENHRDYDLHSTGRATAQGGVFTLSFQI
jgi:hypothetical protein